MSSDSTIRSIPRSGWAVTNFSSKDTSLLGHEGRGITLFDTRAEARAHIREHYGYIRTRRYLRAPPYSWRMPRPVRVKIEVRVLDGREE